MQERFFGDVKSLSLWANRKPLVKKRCWRGRESEEGIGKRKTDDTNEVFRWRLGDVIR